VGFELIATPNGQGGKSANRAHVSAQQTLFHDRLTVQLVASLMFEGNSQTSQDAGAILGNVSNLNNTLTEDGRFKFELSEKIKFESV